MTKHTNIYELLRQHFITQVDIGKAAGYSQPNVAYYLQKHQTERGSLPVGIALAIHNLSDGKIQFSELGADESYEAAVGNGQLPVAAVGKIIKHSKKSNLAFSDFV